MSLSLIYVDDEADLRELVSMAFEFDDRIALTCFATGTEAIDAISQEPAAVDAILMDVMMPGIDGVETALRLRDIDGLKDVPVIFFTAHARSEEHDRLRAAGAAGILAKPFDVMSLADDILSILGQPAS
nr:response regulator [Nitrosomonas nitrosa]